MSQWSVVVITLLGKFKGESGAHRHQVALASTTQSGIEEGGGWSGFWRCANRRVGDRPAFGDRLGGVCSDDVSSQIGVFRAPLKIIAF